MRIKALVSEAFEHYGRYKLFEDEFIKYFRGKGMGDDEIDNLWAKAHSLNIITIGVKPLWEPGHPLSIIGQKTVFSLAGKEGE